MWGNPTLFQREKSIEKILRKDKYLHNHLRNAFDRSTEHEYGNIQWLVNFKMKLKWYNFKHLYHLYTKKIKWYRIMHGINK